MALTGTLCVFIMTRQTLPRKQTLCLYCVCISDKTTYVQEYSFTYILSILRLGTNWQSVLCSGNFLWSYMISQVSYQIVQSQFLCAFKPSWVAGLIRNCVTISLECHISYEHWHLPLTLSLSSKTLKVARPNCRISNYSLIAVIPFTLSRIIFPIPNS